MKKKLALFLFFGAVLLFHTITVSSQNVITLEDDLTLVYDVTMTNEAVNMWFSEDFSESFSYIVENNDEIVLTTTSFRANNPIFSIEIGNLTRERISDFEMESALALGYWQVPNQFGFFGNTSWSLVDQDMKAIEFAEYSFQQHKRETLDLELDIVTFTFDDLSQSTQIAYESSFGLLLAASSNVFGFELAFELVSINSDTSYFKNNSVDTETSIESSASISISLITFLLFTLLLQKRYG